MKLASLGAIELQTEIERANYYSEDSGPALKEALEEIHRLRTICRDIIEIIGTDYAQGAEPNFCLYKIAEIAHRYFKP